MGSDIVRRGRGRGGGLAFVSGYAHGIVSVFDLIV